MEEASGQQKVALFGGTFDPVHSGHLEVAERAVAALALDRVLFLPCRQSPHKEEAAGASEEERLQMLRLATAGLPWAEVSDWEYHQPIPSYSWRTAEAIQAQLGEARLFWLMGWDQWEVLPTWSRFEQLVAQVEFIVHDRHGRSGEQLHHPGARVSYVSGDHPASSSRIRALLAAGEPVPEDWLSVEVSDYLRERQLYL